MTFSFLWTPLKGGSQGIVDLGIGRIPAYSIDDAASVVDKVHKLQQ